MHDRSTKKEFFKTSSGLKKTRWACTKVLGVMNTLVNQVNTERFGTARKPSSSFICLHIHSYYDFLIARKKWNNRSAERNENAGRLSLSQTDWNAVRAGLWVTLPIIILSWRSKGEAREFWDSRTWYRFPFSLRRRSACWNENEIKAVLGVISETCFPTHHHTQICFLW